jgi:hypothetical protein
MTATQIALVTIQVGLVVFVLAFLLTWLLRARQEKYKYKLYAIRDELIYLVATDQLAENSTIFQVLYSTVNSVIAEVHDVDRWSFIRASTRAKTALENAHISLLIHEICEAPLPVVRVAANFFDTMQYIVKANSPFTKFCIACLRLLKNRTPAWSSWLEFLLPKEQFENYRYFRNLSNACHQPL